MLKRLEGKTALVTGAARGIGAAIASAFVEQGATVYLTDIDEALGQSVATALGPRAGYFHLDVREERDWQVAMARILDERSALHVLVNNAGITGFEQGHFVHDPEHVSLDDWHAVHRTNLDGVFLGCKHAIQTMRKSGSTGSIINISSRSGLVGIPGAAAYASSKAAVRNHTKTVALYCAEQGLAIRCNSIHPAAVLTPMQDFVRDCHMRRFGRPREVVAVGAGAAGPLGRALGRSADIGADPPGSAGADLRRTWRDPGELLAGGAALGLMGCGGDPLALDRHRGHGGQAWIRWV